MASSSDSIGVFNNTVTQNGQLCRLRTYKQSYSGTDYDDSYISKSGTDFWFFGMKQPIDNRFGGLDYKYLEQGMIKLDDSKLYVPGSIPINSDYKYKLFIGGSPSITEPFEIIENGVIPWNISGVDIYKKVYVKILNGGSFANEY